MVWGPRLSPAVNRTCGLGSYSWQVILMSSISPISSVINNLISAQATQTHTQRSCANERHNKVHQWQRVAVSLSWAALSDTCSLEIVPSPFISTSQAEHEKASDKTHLKGRAADCLRGDKTTRSSVRAEMHHPNTSTETLPRVNSKADQGRCLVWCLLSYQRLM